MTPRTEALQPGLISDGFAACTMIATPDGERAVETLAPGDRVITYDRGAQDLLWVGPVRRSAVAPMLEIPADAMGNTQNLTVPAGHRLLWSGWQVELLFGTPEVLVEAQALAGMNGIRESAEAEETWLIVLAEPDLVLANGAWCESQMALGAVAEEMATGDGAIASAAPDADAQATSRPLLKPHEAEVLQSYGAHERAPRAAPAGDVQAQPAVEHPLLRVA